MCVKVQVVCLCMCVTLGFQATATRLAIRKSGLTVCFPLIFCFSPKISKSNCTEWGFEMNTMCLNVSKVSVCKRFRITKSVVSISLKKPPWSSVCVCVCVSACICGGPNEFERSLGWRLEPLPAVDTSLCCPCQVWWEGRDGAVA